MEGFTIVDAGVGAIILVSAILAFSRGFVREILAIAGWIIAAVVAFIFTPMAEPLVKEVPVLGEFLADSCELSVLAAFTAVFALALIVVSVFTPLFASIVQRSALSGFDQGLGFLFGVLRGAVLVAVAFVLYDRVVPEGQGMGVVDNSRSASVFVDARASIEKQIPTEAPQWIVERYEQLTGSCQPGAGAPSANESGAAPSGTPPATTAN